MANVINRVQRIDPNTIRVELAGYNEIVIPTRIPLPVFGAVRVRGTEIYHDGKLVADVSPYLSGGDPC